ncbi:hypothetical protein [Gryllotalpicola koreensis]|uniref:Uncharacterized protein n=1 Tax=Gryllotalpicola koreensis TaxID=993086 RepID=A0ABP8A270_9MICO
MGKHEAVLELPKMQSGDLCRFVKDDRFAYPLVEHYRCDDYRDGCVTDPTNGKVIKHSVGGRLGFDREEA